MKVGAIQSSFIPWRGYFDFIDSVDVFVFHDDVQYTKGDWRNRNRIKTQTGLEWLTVPVHHKHSAQLVVETQIDHTTRWAEKHINKFAAHYRGAPFLQDALALLDSVPPEQSATISALNIFLTRRICAYLEISTPLVISTELGLEGRKTERLVGMLKKLKATSYLSGAAADVYLQKERFQEERIRLEYKSYEYPAYPQLWGDFQGGVTVLDLIANCGSDSRNFLKSRSRDQVVA